MLHCFDPAYLGSLETLNFEVTDAEEETGQMVDSSPDRQSHLLTLLRWFDKVPSESIRTVRITFNKVYLPDIISALSPTRLLTDLSVCEAETSSVILTKASKLVQIDTKVLVLPIKFLDDLDLS